ncbi:MAG TPA: DMT family transporter [Eubacteriaceae bacterium]|nr:DMT family transporter [Eubacteriaceae bacterium]
MQTTKDIKRKVNPYFFLIIGVIATSFSAIFVKGSLNTGTPPLIIAFYRLAITSTILIPYSIRFKKEEFNNITKGDIGFSIVSGTFLALHFLTWISSFKYTSTFGSLVLMSLQPIYVVIASYFLFNERISLKAIIVGLIAILGSVIIGLMDLTIGTEAIRGDILALLGGIFLAGYFLCGRRLRQKLSIFPYVSIVYGSCTIILFIVGLAQRIAFYPYSFFNFLMFFALAIVCTIFGHTIFNWVLEYVSPTVVSISLLGEPIGSGLWAFIIFKERLSFWHFIGGGIIILGLYKFILELEKK